MARPKQGYKLKDGTRVPGVTTICSRWKESGGLLNWAFRQGQEGKASLYESRDQAGLIGTYAHELIAWHLDGGEGESPKPDPEMTVSMIERGRVAYNQFVLWEQRTGYKIISWEEPLVSEKYAYGGTPDAVFEWQIRTLLGDWKSAKGIYDDHLLQGGAYIILLEENFPDMKIDGIDIVRFGKDAEVTDHKTVADKKLIVLAKRQFLLLREAYENDKVIKQLF